MSSIPARAAAAANLDGLGNRRAAAGYLVSWRPRAFELSVCFALLALALTSMPRLFDGDSYFHLAVARLYAEQGLVTSLPWARFSVMHAGYGDKELLFHLLLVPFVQLFGHGVIAGQLALALLLALLIVSVAHIAGAAFGRGQGWLVTAIALGTSGSFALRCFRLRPELLSLLLLVWVIWALARQRFWLAAALGCAFALAHTAFHSLAGLSLAWLAWELLAERRFQPRGLWLIAGIALGVVVHPHFPHFLRVWWVQNVDFFRYKAALDVGSEIEPFTLATWLSLDAAWLLALACLAAARVRDAVEPAPATRRAAWHFAIAAVAFCVLFSQMGRFATYFIPLATLGFAFGLRARGFTLGARVPLPGARSIARSAAFVLIAGGGALNAIGTAYVNMLAAGVFDRGRDQALTALARALPPGARVAAHWADTEQYAFFAPHARYLDVLDPVFMRVHAPEQHRSWQQILDGSEPDVPLRLLYDLHSDYIAFTAGTRGALERRLLNDPRMELLHWDRERLLRVRRDRNRNFATEWQLLPEHGGNDASMLRPYPRIADPALRAVEGYVDATRVGGQRGCLRLVHDHEQRSAGTRMYELAPWGASELRVDGIPIVQMAAPAHAHLGEGVAVTLTLAAGTHRFTLRTCPDAGRAGFYLLDRSEH